jgi:hypothetical protein
MDDATMTRRATTRRGFDAILLLLLSTYQVPSQAVLRIRIRIHRIYMFLGLLDPDPYIVKQK